MVDILRVLNSDYLLAVGMASALEKLEKRHPMKLNAAPEEQE